MVSQYLQTALSSLTERIRSSLKVSNALRETGMASVKDSKAYGLYMKVSRELGRLSQELGARLDTIRELVPEEEFLRLLDELKCSWDQESHRATVLEND